MRTKGIGVCLAGMLAAAFLAQEAKAYEAVTISDMGAVASNAPFVLGQFHLDFWKCKAYSEEHDIPMLAIWSNENCVHCYTLDSCFISDTFKEWQKTNSAGQIIMCFMSGGEGSLDQAGSSAYNWMRHNRSLNLYPFVAMYWKSHGIEQHLTGDAMRGNLPNGKDYVEKSVPNVIARLESAFKDWKVNALDEWDSGDDTQAGATALTMAATNSVTAVHTLTGATDPQDLSDWFKFNVVAGKRYRVALADFSASETAPSAAIALGNSSIYSGAMSGLTNGLVFTASSTGVAYAQFSCTGSSAKVSYAVACREYEEVSFAINPASISVNESTGTVALAVTRTGRLTDAATAKYATADGTAVAGTAYTATSGALAFAANETSKTISIKITDRPGYQGDKTFTVALTNLAEESAPVSRATVTIVDEVLSDDAHTGDDTAATAAKYVMHDFTQALSGVDGFEHVLSSEDTADWYRFTTLASGLIYQVKAPAFTKRPATSTADPAVRFYYGAATKAAFKTTTLSALNKTPFRFEATEGADLYVEVADASLGTTVVRYDLAWQQWALPVIAFETNELAIASAANAPKSFTVTLKRTKNLEEKTTVQVAATGDGAGVRYAAATNSVTFAAGAETATTSFTLLADNGVWMPKAQLKLAILEDGLAHQAAATGHAMTVSIATELAEYDASDGANDANAAQSGAVSLAMGKRSQKLDATLNGADAADWYRFDVKADTEYVLKLSDVYPEVTGDPLPFKVQIYNIGGGTAAPIDLGYADVHAGYYHFTPNAERVFVLIQKTAEAGECVKYTLNYREWVPATIGFTENAATVSEYAANLRIGVQCDMEVALPVSVRVKTEDGTATADEDYVAYDGTLAWTDSDPTSSVKYATIDFKKVVTEYEGASESFQVILDFGESDALPGIYTNMTVTISEADAGNAGTFAITGIQGPGDEEMAAYTTKSLSVTEGDAFRIRVSRQDGNAGELKTMLTWNGGEAITTDWADLETEKIVDVAIPATPGECNARTSKTLTLSTSLKTAKTVSGKTIVRFLVTDTDKTLAAYQGVATNVPFSSSGNAWFQAADGALRSKTLAANGSAVMTATLKGEGTLTIDETITGSGTLTVTAGAATPVAATASGAISATVPAGTQRITVTFKASAANSSVTINSVTWTPAESFEQSGTFNGYVSLAPYGLGRFTATISATGRATGRLMFAGKAFSFSATSLEGITAKRGALAIDGITLAFDGGSLYVLRNGDGIGAASRDGWKDKPLTGAFAENCDIPSTYATAGLVSAGGADFATGYMTVRISASGTARFSGCLPNGKAFSSSSPVFADSGIKMVFLPNASYSELLSLNLNEEGTARNFQQDDAIVRAEGVEEISVHGGAYDRAAGFDQLGAGAGSQTSYTIDFMPLNFDSSALWTDVDNATLFFDRGTGKGECSYDGVVARVYPATGIIQGSFRYATSAGRTRKASFRGVMTPNAYSESYIGMGCWLNELKKKCPLVLTRGED